MIRTRFVAGGLAAVLILVLGSCAMGGGDGTDNIPQNPPPKTEPVEVDQSLPAVSELPAFEGKFVENEEDAWKLADTALNQILQNAMGMFNSLDFMDDAQEQMNSSLRALETHEMEPVIFNNQDLAGMPGAKITGYIQGSATTSISDGGPARGDYAHMKAQAKMAVDFNGVEIDDVKIQGRYAVEEDLDGRVDFTPQNNSLVIRASGNLSMTGGYAFSISDTKRNQGIKVRATIVVKGIRKGLSLSMPMPGENFQLDSQFFANPQIFEDLGNPFTQCEFAVKIYDGTGRQKYQQTMKFDDMWEQLSPEFMSE
jgi:hypothetical protein